MPAISSVSAPELATLFLAVALAVPMIIWMRYRDHAWRPAIEMGGASLLLGVALVASAKAGLVPVSDIFEWETRLACPIMILAMLFRLDLYARPMSDYLHVR